MREREGGREEGGEREGEREREREGGKGRNQLAALLLYAFIGGFLYMFCLEREPAGLVHQEDTLTNWTTRQDHISLSPISRKFTFYFLKTVLLIYNELHMFKVDNFISFDICIHL